jgi:hypothetical protein
MEYQKIQTLFKRDDNGIIIPAEYTLEEFNYLKDCVFECTEKIDGMNARVEINRGEIANIVSYKGRTDKAIVPIPLYNYMCETFPKQKVLDLFPECNNVTIYGEGYGVKIQNGGNYISNGVSFILFDVRVGGWWLSRKDCEEIANKLNIGIVPIIGYMTIPQAIEYVDKGFKSTIAENKNYDAEGLVLRTPNGLKLRNGERIIIKIKTRDFVKYRNSQNKLK